MIQISNEDIHRNLQAFINKLKENNGAILESAYLQKTFPKYAARNPKVYPYTVKIPKSLPELAQGDFEPAQIITVTEPFKGPYCDIWFGDSSAGVDLHCGYVDGNSSIPSNFVLGDANAHMILGGATGQGKSVTLNSIIFGMCLQYAPWEIDLTLCDAKIVEFKAYATQTPIPHIRRIAATDDTDYILSVIETLRGEFSLVNAAFDKAGVKKLEDFRKVTGLCFPQHIIVIDEFQTMFQNAKKKAQAIATLLDSFGRLGRNVGYHLILASQEVGSDIPNETLGNIKLRACLGCNGRVSDKVLGNDSAASNYGQKGRLILNDQPAEKDNKKYNVDVVVPFMPDNERLLLGTDLITQGNKTGFKSILSFFDSEVAITEGEYEDFLNSFAQKKRILLGPPSYIIPDDEQVVSLELTGKDIENIVVLTAGNNNNERYFKMLMSNIQRIPRASNVMLCLDTMFNERCQANKFATNNYYSERNTFLNNDMFNLAFTMIARRKLCMAIDEFVFSTQKQSYTYVEDFYKQFAKGSEIDTELNRQRFEVGMYLLGADIELNKLFGLDGIQDKDAKYRKSLNCVAAAVETINMYGCTKVQLGYNDIPPLFVWVLGLDKIIGLGRDNRSSNVNRFKNYLLDSSKYNVRFIIFTNTLMDMKELTNGIRWCIVDNVSIKEYSKIEKVEQDDFPEQVGPLLAMITDQLEPKNKVRKFKKMQLTGEFLR